MIDSEKNFKNYKNIYPCTLAALISLAMGMLYYIREIDPFENGAFIHFFVLSALGTSFMNLIINKNNQVRTIIVYEFASMCILAFFLMRVSPSLAVMLTTLIPILVDASSILLIKDSKRSEQETFKNIRFNHKEDCLILLEYGDGIEYVDGYAEYMKIAEQLRLMYGIPIYEMDFYIDKFYTKKDDESRFIHITGNDEGISVVNADVVKENVMQQANEYIESNVSKHI